MSGDRVVGGRSVRAEPVEAPARPGLTAMALGPRLDLRQSQSLVMTPQLQQAIKLLALSNLELEAFIGSELERNLLLEAGAEPAQPAREQSELPDGAEPRSGPAAPADILIGKGSAEADAPLDVD